MTKHFINNANEQNVLLSLGSNLGNRSENISKALDLLSTGNILSDITISSIYETEPFGYKNQPWFLNTAVLGSTHFTPQILLSSCQQIERKIGRKSHLRWREREIDIDIILYGNLIINSDKISIPHPAMHLRRFVLAPANEIAGSMMHPKFGKTIKQLLMECADRSEVRLIESLVID
jgi:2-amino-4-hydroxy-6-hydroxymethyldihydropteridine diphosphokinase